MGFWSGLGNILVGGATGGLLKPFGNKKKSDPYAELLGKIEPLIKSQTEIATKESTSGLANTAAARGDFDYVNNFLKNILTGSDDNLLKMLDVSGATKNIDENEQMLSELGVRGGRRAAALGQTSFDRDALLSNYLKQLRFAAPNQLAQIAQSIGNLGLGELSASSGGSAQASQNIFGVEGLKQADKDRRAQMISAIFESIGAIGGMAAGSL